MKKEAAVAALNSTVFLFTWKASRQSGSSHGRKGKVHLIAAEMLVQKVTKQYKSLFSTELWSEELRIVWSDPADRWCTRSSVRGKEGENES